MRRAFFVALVPSVALLALVVTFGACSSTSTVATADAAVDAEPVVDAGIDTLPADTGIDAPLPPPERYTDGPLKGCAKDPGGASVVPIKDPTGADDPAGDAKKFTLAMALNGYPTNATGELVALITTEKGTIRCVLTPDVAPATVANFVGLARGTRPFDNGTIWTTKKFYDGLIWHRVVPNFVVQGGDPKGNGTGGSGYDLVDENHVAEPAGTLAMAANTAPSGSQFYIVVGTGPGPDYNVFGSCETAVAIDISNVDRDSNNKPTTPVHMQTIDIAKCPPK